MISLLQRIRKLNIGVFVLLSVALSEFLTSLMSILLQGRITRDYLITGGIVSLIVSGIVVYFLNRIFGLADENEALQREILSRQQAEEELRLNEERYRLLMETSPSAITVSDISGRILMANHRALSIFGHSDIAEALGRSIFEWVRDEEKERASTVFAGVLDGQLLDNFEIRLQKGNGDPFWGSINASVVRGRDGVPQLVTIVTTDITDRKRIEGEIIKTQKLEAIGTLAGGIAHDFNNLLQGVFGCISLAKLRRDDSEKSLAALESAEKALHRSVKLTTQLLTFSKGGKPVKRPMDLRKVLGSAAGFALAGSRTTFCIVADDGLWPVEADEGQIGQVIHNIVLNADQAMPDGGQVAIAARNVQAPRAGIPGGLKAGKYAEVTIRDGGVGIPEQHLTKIFDPYFTTKPRGSGLGLATSYAIIKNHGGLIEVRSEVGKGATFFLYIPATEAVLQEESPKAAVVAATGRTGKILFMDDEELLREIALEMIGSLGHEVVLVENGREAIASYGEALRLGRPFDVVILDLTIRGGMGGEEAMVELLKLDPGIKAVVSSGYADSAAISDHKAHGFMASLKKPYDIEELSNTLNSLLQ